jgi:hypothetical protein
MEVGQGQIWSCSAKGKNIATIIVLENTPTKDSLNGNDDNNSTTATITNTTCSGSSSNSSKNKLITGLN